MLMHVFQPLFCKISQLNLLCIQFTAPFNNMQTMNFKIQPLHFSLPPITAEDLLENKKSLSPWGQKIMFVYCD